MTRSAWIVAMVTGIVATAGVAGADVLQATRSQPLRETAHTVDIYVDEGVATYTVRRTFENPGTLAEQVELEIGLPYGAAATGLRIRAGDRWYLGELMERELAAARYEELTGYGSHVAKDPALLAWMWADTLSLQVFPVLPGRSSTVEYTLTVPTRYQHGRYVLSYPRVAATAEAASATAVSLPLAQPVITVRPSWGHAHTAIVVDGTQILRDTPTVLRAPVRPPWADAIESEATASYVASSLEVPRTARTSRSFSRATVQLDLRHTYQGDLRVELIPPSGRPVSLHDRTGSGTNDLRGKHVVEIPEGTTGAGTWRLVVSDHEALDTGSLDRWSLTLGTGAQATTSTARDTPVFVPDAPESATEAGIATIAIAPPSIATWTARLGRVVASAEHAFSRLEIDVAPELVPLPRRAQVVFVVDTSYSLTARGVQAQLDLARAYLAHVPDAEVEIVTYRREARRAFGRFVPASSLSSAVASARRRGAFALGNGSALDAGARLATTLLADRPGPRRVVLVTDELTRSSLRDVEALAALGALSAETVVHVVVPETEPTTEVELVRRDDAALAALATRHHGIFVDLRGLVGGKLSALVPVVLELVRPTRIEKVAIPGFELDTDVLEEGDGVRLMLDTPTAPARVTLTGLLWSDPVNKDVVVGAAFSRATAGFVFGEDRHESLSEAEQLKVAMFGRAVSPVTSYLAIEPGVRPSTIGFRDEGRIGTGRFGTIGHGSGTGSGYGRRPPDFTRLIDIRACVRRLRPAGAWRVKLAIETTRDEIVDVRIGAPSAMANCLAETAWALRLAADEFPAMREDFVVELSGPAVP